MRYTSKHGQRWLPALFFAIAIFMFSATPGDEVAESFDALNTTVNTLSASVQSAPAAEPAAPVLSPAIDWLKVGHVIGYFCLGISILYGLSFQNRWAIALTLSSLYSMTDELHQMFVPGRSASLRDVLLDTLAALAGILLVMGVRVLRGYWVRRHEL